jgi:hypothetical protein
MRKLMAEYDRQDENLEDATESTQQGVTLLVLKGSLEQKDLFDRGDFRQPWEDRYGLVPALYQKVDRLIGELQHFLSCASELVPGRTRHFHIDPEDSIVPILQGASSVAQLVAAWEILRSRLESGQKFLTKYENEFYSSDVGKSPMLSPTSTTVELEEELKVLDGGDQKMRHMVAYYPHHSFPMREDQVEGLVECHYHQVGRRFSFPPSWWDSLPRG